MRSPLRRGLRDVEAPRTLRGVLAVLAGLLCLAVGSPALADPPPAGLVAAYAFDEGTGTLAADASGNGHSGALVGTTWTAGHSGSAASFNGTSAYVDLGALGTFYQTAFTLEAW